MTASASAIWGTRRGCTKLTASIRLIPLATSRPMSSTFTSVATRTSSFCNPSRGATSTISMLPAATLAPRYSSRHHNRKFGAYTRDTNIGDDHLAQMPLGDIRVIEMGQLLAGPFCA